ncbi:MAG: Ig-like domain-containing protein [Sulfurifustis sp.]
MRLSTLLRTVLITFFLTLANAALAQTTVILMDGQNGYAGTTDTRLINTDVNEGTRPIYELINETSTSLAIRFAIFQSEGGPVPNDATIDSATLSLYKYHGPASSFKASRFLKNWTESGARWSVTGTGASWGSAGALSAGNDYLATPDGQATVGDATVDGCETTSNWPAACWLNIDVTAGVRAFRAGTLNYGWKVADNSGMNGGTPREFNSRENTNWPLLRPKLTITYSPSGPLQAQITLAPGSVVMNDEYIDITASATDARVLQSAAFVIDGAQQALVTTAPFKFRWQPTPADTIGSHTLLVRITDTNGNTASATQTLTLLSRTCNLFANGTTVLNGETWGSVPQGQVVELQGVCSDNSPITSIDFFVDGVLQLNDTTAPYTYTLNTGALAIGAHTLAVRGYLTNGAVSNHAFTINITAATPPPTAQLTATPGTGTEPLTVTFNASGSTAQSPATITSLRLQFGHNNQEVTWSDKNVTQSHTYPAGTYTAALTVTDSNNATATVQRTITVNPQGGSEFPSPLPDAVQAGVGAAPVPTFHSIGLYYNGNFTAASPPPGNQVFVRYRRATDDPSAPGFAWKQGYPLWYDVRTVGNALPYDWRGRGSVVLLQPGTKYVFEFGTGSSYAQASWQHSATGTTWSETLPEGTTTIIPSQSSAYVITQGGTPSAYRVYDGWNGTSKNVVNRGGAGVNNANAEADDTSHAIVVKASYVIVRRVRATGAAIAGIYVAPNVTDVVIEDTQVDDWAWRPESRFGTNPNSWGTWGWNQAGGIHLGGSNARIVIQRNIIKAPHFGSFPWDTGGTSCAINTHPAGPFGITIEEGTLGAQQNVIRYNEITGDPTNRNKWYQDGISGQENFSAKGAPGADSDIYQNIIMHVYDDAIEAEGGGRNVRVWGNYISDTKTAIATTTVHYGPTYVWRNVVNRVRMCYQTVRDTDANATPSGSGFKYGGFDNGYGRGIRYLFHNSILEQPSGQFPAAPVYGIEGPTNGDGSVQWTISRNNIFYVWNPTYFSIEAGDTATGSSFAYDVYNGRIHGITEGTPATVYKYTNDATVTEFFYKPGHGYSSVPALGGNGTGNYQLGTTESGVKSKGLDVGDAIANFSDGYFGPAPDVGAHEDGAPPMKFGISAGQ